MPDLNIIERGSVTLDAALISGLAERAKEYASRSKAENTVTTYEGIWRRFLAWCDVVGIDPRQDTEQVIAHYVTARAEDLSASSIGLLMSAIRSGFECAGIKVDMNDPYLKSVVAGIKRTIGTRPERKAVAAIPEILRVLLNACPEPAEAVGARDRAMLLIGFSAALRRSEIVALRIGDVTIVPGRGLRVLVSRSKTDQTGVGKELAIAANPLDPEFCPVVAINRWLEHRRTVSAEADAPLFCAMSTRGGRVTGAGLTDKTMVRVIKKAAAGAGLAYDAFSGHSLRRGFMTAAAGAGASLTALMRHSRHTSTQNAIGYIEEAGMWTDNVSDRVFQATRGQA